MHGAYYYTTTDTYCMASAVRARARARPWRLMGAPSLASPCGIRHSEVPFRRALPKYPSEVAAWHTGRAAGRGPAASVPPAHFGHRRHPTQLPSPGLVKDGCLNSKAPRSQPPLPGLGQPGMDVFTTGFPVHNPPPTPGLASQGVWGVHSRVPRSQPSPPKPGQPHVGVCRGGNRRVHNQCRLHSRCPGNFSNRSAAPFTAGAPFTSGSQAVSGGQLPLSQPVPRSQPIHRR